MTADTPHRQSPSRWATGAPWLRGSVAMAGDAYAGTVDLVHDVHRAVSDTGARINPVAVPERMIRDGVYACVRGIGAASFHGVRSLVSLTAQTTSDQSNEQPAGRSQTLRSALNGAIGDYLDATGNELAQPMRFIDDAGRVVDPNTAPPIPAERATSRLVVMIHGLGMHDGQWQHAEAPDFGARLAADYGYTALRLRYNSGRPITDSGRELAKHLEALAARYPTALSRITLIGHSMGGLVAHSALGHAKKAGHAWIEPLADVVCLGSPHRGAPLERLGNGLNQTLTYLPYTRPFSAIGELRSAGVKNLRHGEIFETSESELGPRVGDDIGYFLVAATLGKRHADPIDLVFGDLLVPVASAFGHLQSKAATHSDGCVFYGMSHFALVYHDDVYDALVEWLGARLCSTPSSGNHIGPQRPFDVVARFFRSNKTSRNTFR